MAVRRGRGDPGLAPRRIIGLALATFRDRWRRILPIAAVIAVISSFADLAAAFVDDMDHAGPVVAAAVALTVAMNTGAATVGATMLAGILDRTVGEHQHGHPEQTLPRVLRHLPWMHLIVADLLVTLLRVLGFVAFLLPGFAVITLTGVTGPVIMLERRKPIAAIRRSFHLVRPHFWLAFVLVTVPLTFEGILEAYIEGLPFLHDALAHLLALVMLEVPVSTLVALIEVTLAYQLIERDRPGTVAAAAHH